MLESSRTFPQIEPSPSQPPPLGSWPPLRFRGSPRAWLKLGLLHRPNEKRSLVYPRRLAEAADLPDELERSSPNLLLSSRRVEVEEYSDVSAQSPDLKAHIRIRLYSLSS